MKQLSLLLILLIAGSAAFCQKRYVMVIHGGAGTILKENMTPEREQAFKEALTTALRAGYERLQAGASSLDAVEAAILTMEDNPLFNAGKGAVFTHEGKNELDASIMWGPTQAAGAVAGVTTVRNPILAARAVMEQSEHVMLTGKGAEAFAEARGLETVTPDYFRTENRWQELQRALAADLVSAASGPDNKFGTVGAVALDSEGRLAAGTSTGGMTNKQYGRVGDAPIIGAGTYANEQVGISCTGWGEFFIRGIAAYDVAARMAYTGIPLAEAAEAVINHIDAMGGDGGMIALDADGNVAMPFSTAGMYRGAITETGEIELGIYQ